MGYHTEFEGTFNIFPNLTSEHQGIIDVISDERHDGTDLKEPPSFYCQWVTDYNGSVLAWDGGEKFYRYVDWLEYLIHNYFGPWGYLLNGEVQYRGEGYGDHGTIIVRDNRVHNSHRFNRYSE